MPGSLDHFIVQWYEIGMEEKKGEAPSLPPAVCTPPSHPTTLGDVWSGEARTPERAMVAALKNKLAAWPSQESRHD